MSFPRFSRSLNPFLIIFLRLVDIEGCWRPSEAAGGHPKVFLSALGERVILAPLIGRGNWFLLIWCIYLNWLQNTIRGPAFSYGGCRGQQRPQNSLNRKIRFSRQVIRLFIGFQGPSIHFWCYFWYKVTAVGGHQRPLEAIKKLLISLRRKGHFGTLDRDRTLILFIWQIFTWTTCKIYLRTSL